MKLKINLDFLKSKRFWAELISMTLGLLVGAAAVNYFIIPSKLILGSVSGLAVVISTLLSNAGITLEASTIILIINAVLLVLAYVLLGSEVGIKTIFASLLLGPFINLLQAILPYQSLMEPGATSVMGEPIFDLLAFVLLLGASQAFLFRINASTGGLDIVALIMKKYLHMEIGTAVTISGLIVCLSAFSIHSFRMVAIGLIGTWFNGLVVDYFTISLNKRKRVCIISPHYEEIREYIIDKLQRGCSLYKVQGGYSGEDSFEIQSILTQSEFANLMEFIRKNDYHAFTTAGNCSEVYGLWHRNHKKIIRG